MLVPIEVRLLRPRLADYRLMPSRHRCRPAADLGPWRNDGHRAGGVGVIGVRASNEWHTRCRPWALPTAAYRSLGSLPLLKQNASTETRWPILAAVSSPIA